MDPGFLRVEGVYIHSPPSERWAVGMHDFLAICSGEISARFSPMKKKSSTLALRPVERPDQVRSLASTVRQDLIDTVQALGRASVPELAEHLSRPPDSLYYHVRALLEAGLLVRLPNDRVRAGRSEAMYSTAQPQRRLQVTYRTGDGDATRALNALVGNMLRSAQRDFAAASQDPGCVVTGPQRELWAGRCKGWLSPAELTRCNALLTELTGLLSAVRTPERDRLFSVQFLLAPARTRTPASPASPPEPSPRTPAPKRRPTRSRT